MPFLSLPPIAPATLPRTVAKARANPGRLSPEWVVIGRALAPSPAEFRAMLADLHLVFPGAQLANVLGVPFRTCNAWELGIRKPSDAARRAVWLVWCLVLHPARLATVFDLVTWGRFRRDRRPRKRSARQSFAQVIADDWSI